MKISVIFVAGAHAFTCGDPVPHPCEFDDWINEIAFHPDNWWASSVERFNFASNNWKKFTDTVKQVSWAIICCKENNNTGCIQF